MQYYIEEAAWEQLYGFLQGQKGLHRHKPVLLRRFIEGVWYIMRSGCQWRLLPEHYGCWRGVHRRFKRWCEAGIWERMLAHFIDADLEYVMIDATIVRAHSCAAGYGKDSQDTQALGRSKGGFTTKIHALVDALGNPLKFILTSGQRNEITQAEALTKAIADSTVIADKGFDSNAFIDTLANKRNKAVIPSRCNRKSPRTYDEHLYKERHLIECFFGKIKYFRRIFSRFDKAASTFLAFLHFAATLIWLN
jgi:transposase